MIMRDASRELRITRVGRSTALANILTTGYALTSVWHLSSLISSNDDGMLFLMCSCFAKFSSLLNPNKLINVLSTLLFAEHATKGFVLPILLNSFSREQRLLYLYCSGDHSYQCMYSNHYPYLILWACICMYMGL